MYNPSKLLYLPDHEQSITQELQSLGIPVFKSRPPDLPSGESWRRESDPVLRAPVFGKYGDLVFRRTERHWLVNGPVPLTKALKLYATDAGKHHIHVDAHGLCPPPDKAYWHDVDCDHEASIVVAHDELRFEELKARYGPDSIPKGNDFVGHKFYPAGTHLRDGCVHLYSVDSYHALMVFLEIYKSS